MLGSTWIGLGRDASMRRRQAMLWFVAAFVAVPACGSGDQDPASSSANGNATGGRSGIVMPTAGRGGADGGGSLTIDPKGFTAAEIGAYKLGAPLKAEGAGTFGDTGCGDYLAAVVRDFKGANVAGGHPDFETFSGNDVTPNLVAFTLGTDQKPVYASQCEAANAKNRTLCPYGQQTTTRQAFDQWYRYTINANQPFLVYFQFERQAGGLLTFESRYFFPLDNAGWGNSGTGTDDKSHNFHFTTEVHTRFVYGGGETFQFIGDDDVWVFINKKLAVDIGGLHPTMTRSIRLDERATALDLVKGQTYTLDLFHAERHTDASRFRIDTTLSFVNCGTVVPDVY